MIYHGCYYRRNLLSLNHLAIGIHSCIIVHYTAEAAKKGIAGQVDIDGRAYRPASIERLAIPFHADLCIHT
jgi:hypothetical protein